MGVVLNSTEGVCILPSMCPPRLLAERRKDNEIPPLAATRVLTSQVFDAALNGRRNRILTTIMLTDIVDSTQSAADMGDHDWSRLLDRHDEIATQVVDRYSGVLAKTTGDGVVATFDVPSFAVRCGLALQSAARLIGLTLRIGIHTGEVELMSGDLRGVAVHAAARVMRKCAPGRSPGLARRD